MDESKSTSQYTLRAITTANDSSPLTQFRNKWVAKIHQSLIMLYKSMDTGAITADAIALSKTLVTIVNKLAALKDNNEDNEAILQTLYLALITLQHDRGLVFHFSNSSSQPLFQTQFSDFLKLLSKEIVTSFPTVTLPLFSKDEKSQYSKSFKKIKAYCQSEQDKKNAKVSESVSIICSAFARTNFKCKAKENRLLNLFYFLEDNSQRNEQYLLSQAHQHFLTVISEGSSASRLVIYTQSCKRYRQAYKRFQERLAILSVKLASYIKSSINRYFTHSFFAGTESSDKRFDYLAFYLLPQQDFLHRLYYQEGSIITYAEIAAFVYYTQGEVFEADDVLKFRMEAFKVKGLTAQADMISTSLLPIHVSNSANHYLYQPVSLENKVLLQSFFKSAAIDYQKLWPAALERPHVMTIPSESKEERSYNELNNMFEQDKFKRVLKEALTAIRENNLKLFEYYYPALLTIVEQGTSKYAPIASRLLSPKAQIESPLISLFLKIKQIEKVSLSKQTLAFQDIVLIMKQRLERNIANVAIDLANSAQGNYHYIIMALTPLSQTYQMLQQLLDQEIQEIKFVLLMLLTLAQEMQSFCSELFQFQADQLHPRYQEYFGLLDDLEARIDDKVPEMIDHRKK